MDCGRPPEARAPVDPPVAAGGQTHRPHPLAEQLRAALRRMGVRAAAAGAASVGRPSTRSRQAHAPNLIGPCRTAGPPALVAWGPSQGRRKLVESRKINHMCKQFARFGCPRAIRAPRRKMASGGAKPDTPNLFMSLARVPVCLPCPPGSPALCPAWLVSI